MNSGKNSNQNQNRKQKKGFLANLAKLLMCVNLMKSNKCLIAHRFKECFKRKSEEKKYKIKRAARSTTFLLESKKKKKQNKTEC